VLGIPRGGVVVAAEVARRLGVPLDVIVARKLGAPISEELAIGAVTANGGRFLNTDVIEELGVSEGYIDAVTQRQQAEARRRETLFRGERPPLDLTGRTVILVDDGLATGATMRAAARSLRHTRAARLVAAVPVASAQARDALRAEVDEVVCLSTPEPFGAVGAFYDDFRQTEDEEVQELLARSAPGAAA
jgi:predicted phosphoribosyltransferase